MFIVFEGIDGCGKTTQVRKLAKYLFDLNKYNHVLLTREPYKQREIRNILKSNNDPYSQKEKLTQLYVEDRKEHVEESIKPALEKNIIVISDRYKYSTICYQAAQGQDMQKLIEVHNNLPVPDYIFIIDTPTEIAFKRMEIDSREKNHKFEKNKEFLEKVRQNYLKIKEIFPNEKIIVIDGRKPINEIFEKIKEFFNNI